MTWSGAGIVPANANMQSARTGPTPPIPEDVITVHALMRLRAACARNCACTKQAYGRTSDVHEVGRKQAAPHYPGLGSHDMGRRGIGTFFSDEAFRNEVTTTATTSPHVEILPNGDPIECRIEIELRVSDLPSPACGPKDERRKAICLNRGW